MVFGLLHRTLNFRKDKRDNQHEMRPKPLTITTLLLLGSAILASRFSATANPAPTNPPAAASAAPAAPAARKANPSDTLDIKRVHAEYGDGNFETVVQILEDFRAKHDHYRLRDSVLVAKYLGVVFAANPDSREKGKYWLYKMLQMDPTEDLVDLYVGEEVEHTFDKVRQEFIVRRNYRGINDTKLAKAVQTGDEPGKRDTIVRRDTVVLKGNNWVSPITDVVKDGLSEVKGDIKAGIESGYVPIKEEPIDKGLPWTGNVNLGAGIKFLDKAWEVKGLTDETEFRFAFDLRQRAWPINIAVNLSYAVAPDVYWDLQTDDPATDKGIPKVNVTTYEFDVGVRKIVDFKLYSVRPFFGGGFGRTITQQQFTGDKYNETFQDGKIGIWFDGGVYWELDKHFNIGLEYDYSWAKIDLFGTRNHGGTHFDMIAGYHF